MSFPRSPCQTCKAQKVKCDEAHPVCSRCKRSGRVCLRRNAVLSPLAIHIENSFASGRIKRPRGPRSSLREAALSISGPVQRPLGFDLLARATAYYAHVHLRTPPDFEGITSSLEDYVLATWKCGRPRAPIVDLAMSSVALAVFSRTQKCPQAYVEASSQYQQLLKAVRAAFSTLSEANIDDCLLANFFMSRFEDSFHRKLRLGTLTLAQNNPHKDGAMAILKFWRDNLYPSYPATNTIKQIRRGLLRFAARDNLGVPDWMMDGEVFGEYGLELEFDCIIVRLTTLRRRLYTLLRGTPALQEDTYEPKYLIQQLKEEAGDIDNLLEDWPTRFPSAWNYQPHVVRGSGPWPKSHLYSSTVYSCSSSSYAAIWVKYFATRMLSIQTRLQLLDLGVDSSDLTSQQRRACLSELEHAARSLACTIPSCLGILATADSHRHQDPVAIAVEQEVKPHLSRLLSWHLCLASSLEYVDISLRQWFLTELQYLGKISGVKLFECADLDRSNFQ